MVFAILAIASAVSFGLAGRGFQTGAMYGRAIDVERQKNPSLFKFLGLIYCLMGTLFLIGAILQFR